MSVVVKPGDSRLKRVTSSINGCYKGKSTKTVSISDITASYIQRDDFVEVIIIRGAMLSSSYL